MNTIKKCLYPPYIIISIITILYITLALLRHFHFMTYGYDLGIYDQQVWLYANFKNPFLTIENKFALLNHFSPSLALLAPIYWVISDPRALLITQAVLIGASAIPFDILARKKNLPLYLRSAIIITYLTFYGYQFSINFDVHSLPLGVALIPWLILFIEERKYKKAAICLFIILGMKESFPVLITIIAMVYFLKGRKKLGIYLASIALAYLYTALKIIQPILEYIFNEQYRFTTSIPSNIESIITSLYDTKEKKEVWKLSFLWYALLPLAAPITVLAAIGEIAFYFILGNNHPETLTIFMHYRSPLAVLLTWANIEACANLYKHIPALYEKLTTKYPSKIKNAAPWIKQSIYPAITLMLICSMAYYQYTYHLPLNSLTKPYYYTIEKHIYDKYEILKKVPSKAAIAAQNNLSPHLSQRENIHILWPYRENGGYLKFPICQDALTQATYGQEEKKNQLNKDCPSKIITSPCGQEYCFWLRFHESVQYIITDTRPGQNAVQLLMQNETVLKEGLANLEKTGIITPIAKKGETTLWQVILNTDEQKI